MYRNIYWELEQFHTMSKMSQHVDSSGLQRVFRSKRPCRLESFALESLNLCLEYVPLWYQRVAQQKQGTWQQILHINSFTPLDIYSAWERCIVAPSTLTDWFQDFLKCLGTISVVLTKLSYCKKCFLFCDKRPCSMSPLPCPKSVHPGITSRVSILCFQHRSTRKWPTNPKTPQRPRVKMEKWPTGHQSEAINHIISFSTYTK